MQQKHPQQTPGRRSQVGWVEEGTEVRRKRGGVAIVHGLTDGSVAQGCGHPAHSGPAKERSGVTPKCSAAALGRCQGLLQIAGARAV